MTMKVASAQENINSISRDCLRGGNIFLSLSKKSLFACIIKFSEITTDLSDFDSFLSSLVGARLNPTQTLGWSNTN